jgi:ubiquinone/menaquinone biosynthesis C-methylase UbiE
MKRLFRCPRFSEDLNEYETVGLKKIEKAVRSYFRFSSEKQVLTREIVNLIKPEKSLSLLDVGCGEGYVIRKLHREVNHCVALDPDARMLETLKIHLADNSNVIFVKKKLEDFRTGERFDVTLSSHTLSFFSNKQNAIDKMLSLTKSEGRLVLVLHCYDSEQLGMLREFVAECTRREKKIDHIDAETLCCYLVKRGLNPTLKRVETIAIFPSIESLLHLSYFLFRVDYARASKRNRDIIRECLEKKRYNHHFEIRTTHGIVTIRKMYAG